MLSLSPLTGPENDGAFFEHRRPPAFRDDGRRQSGQGVGRGRQGCRRAHGRRAGFRHSRVHLGSGHPGDPGRQDPVHPRRRDQPVARRGRTGPAAPLDPRHRPRPTGRRHIGGGEAGALQRHLQRFRPRGQGHRAGPLLDDLSRVDQARPRRTRLRERSGRQQLQDHGGRPRGRRRRWTGEGVDDQFPG